MADRYWIQETGDWSDTSHWSAESGGVGGESEPSYLDNAYFDYNSFDFGFTALNTMAVFGSKLYAGGYPHARLLVWDDIDTWTVVASTALHYEMILALVVFNSKLYGTAYPSGRLLEWNGTNAWVEVAPMLSGQNNLSSLAVYNSKIYAGTSDGGYLFEWNGVDAWVQVATILNSQTDVFSLAVFDGHLFGGTSPNARLFKWNDTDAWTQVAGTFSAGQLILALVVFGGNLYGSSAYEGNLLRWNGTDSWVEVAPAINGQTSVNAIAVYNAKLYGVTDGGRLLEWNGTDAWVEKAPQAVGSYDLYALVVYGTKLYSVGAGYRVLLEWNDADAWDVKVPASSLPSATVTLDKTASCLNMDWTGAQNSPIFDLGANTLNINGNFTTVEFMTVTPGTSIIKMLGDDKTFTSANKTFNVVETIGTPITFAGDNSYFGDIKGTAGKTIKITSDSHISVDAFSGEGSVGNLVVLEATIENTPGYIDKTSGTIVVQYWSIKDITAAGGAAFYAANSVDGGGNLGFIFGFPPVSDIDIEVAALEASSTTNALIPTITAGTDKTVTAVKATSTSLAKAPVVDGNAMGSRYWVGGSGDWSDINHWSRTSNGTPGATVPTSINSAYFDQNSTSAYGKEIVNLLEFNGELYGVTVGNQSPGKLVKWDGIWSWIDMTPYRSVAGYVPLCVFDGAIYKSDASGDLFKWNGVDSWGSVLAPGLRSSLAYGGSGISVAGIQDLCVFNGELYGSTTSSYSDGNAGFLYKWNGVNAWIEMDYIYVDNTILNLTEFDGALYGTPADCALFRWTPETHWVQVAPVYTGSNVGVGALCEYNGKLYGGTDQSRSTGTSNGSLLEWNGIDAWVLVAPMKYTERDITSLCVFNGKLHACTGNSGLIYKWNDSNAWIYVAGDINGHATPLSSLCVFNGYLYGASIGISKNSYHSYVSGCLAEWKGTGNTWTNVAPSNTKINIDEDVYCNGLFTYNVKGYPAFHLNSYTLTCYGFFNMFAAARVFPGTSTIKMYGAEFTGLSSGEYNNIECLNASVNFWGNPTFNDVKALPGNTIEIYSGYTLNINSLSGEATAGSPITLTTSGQHSNLRKTTGVVSVEHWQIRNSYAAGGAVFSARKSANLGGNSGWLFDIIKPVGTIKAIDAKMATAKMKPPPIIIAVPSITAIDAIMATPTIIMPAQYYIEILEYQRDALAEAGTDPYQVVITGHGLQQLDRIVNRGRDYQLAEIQSLTKDAERGSRVILNSDSGSQFGEHTLDANTLPLQYPLYSQVEGDVIKLYRFVDRTGMLRPMSFKLTRRGAGQSDFAFEIITDSNYILKKGQYVRVYTPWMGGYSTEFLGTISGHDEEFVGASQTVIAQKIQCQGLNHVASRRTVRIDYVAGTYYYAIVRNMVTTILLQEGIWVGNIQFSGYTLVEDWKNDAISVQEVLDECAAQCHYQWYIDNIGGLYFQYPPTDGIALASHNLDGVWKNYTNLKFSSSSTDYYNKIFVCGGNDEMGNPIIFGREDYDETFSMQNITGDSGVHGLVSRDSGMIESDYKTCEEGSTTSLIVMMSHNQSIGDIVWNYTTDEYRQVLTIDEYNSSFTVEPFSNISAQSTHEAEAGTTSTNINITNHGLAVNDMVYNASYGLYLWVLDVIDGNNFRTIYLEWQVPGHIIQIGGHIIGLFNSANAALFQLYQKQAVDPTTVTFDTPDHFDPMTKLWVDLPAIGQGNQYFLIEDVTVVDRGGNTNSDSTHPSLRRCWFNVKATKRNVATFSVQRKQDYMDYWRAK